MKSKHPPSPALGDREVAICRRFRDARLHAKWKMPDFANELEIPRDRLASYEYARSPIRYSLARKMCDRFNINQRWLATGRLPSRHYVDVHAYTEGQIPDKMLFSEAYDIFLSKPLDAQIAQLAKGLHCSEEEIENNWQRIGVSWPVGYPGAKLSELYHQRLSQFRLHKQPEGVQKKIYQQLNAVLDQLLPGGGINTRLTIKADSLTNTSVQPILPKLIQRLKRATEARGSKSELAKWLGVHRQSVTDWLSGKQKPGGEITLKLLQWVEQKERQK